MKSGLTLDTGILIGWERGDERIRTTLSKAIAQRRRITIPATVLAEAWRDPRSWELGRLISGADIEPLDAQLAKRAGELCARVEGATTIDATVAVSAARRGDTVVTTDGADLLRLAEELPAIRVWAPSA